MKKQLAKKIPAFLNMLYYRYILLLSCIIYSACGPQTEEKNEIKKTAVVQGFKTVSSVAPITTYINQSNQSKITLDSASVSTIDASNGGAVFFTNYGTEQGLPLSFINCIMQDDAGSLWFGTAGAGATRYDGKGFTTYATAQGLASNKVLCITQDLFGNIWFGTEGGGASRYDGKRFVNYTTTNGLAGNIVQTIVRDNAGNIWFGTRDGGASKYDGNKFLNFHAAQGLADKNVFGIIQDKAGNMWFATGRGASMYNGRAFINYTKAEGLAGNIVWCVTQDNAGNIWFGTNGGGASKYNGKAFTNYNTANGLASNGVYSLMQDNAGNVWFGTSKGTSRYNGKAFTNYTTIQGLAGNSVRSIMQDKAGNIWIGTGGGGASRYDGKSVTNFTTAQGLANNTVWSVMQDRRANIWFGTYGGGASMYNGKNFINHSLAKGQVNNSIYSIMQDNVGNIWFGTAGGLVIKYNGKTFTNYSITQGLMGNAVSCIIQDNIGNIWIGTEGGGINKFNGKSFANYTTAQGLRDNVVYCMLQDNAGNIWVGTYGGGVSKYDGKNFINFTTTQGLAGNAVYCMMQDHAGNIWFGTDGGGVSKYNGKFFTNYTTAQGLADNVVYAVAEDTTKHIIWLGTNLGLSGLKIANPPKEDTFEIFNKNTGYPIKDLNTNALIVDKNGVVWAGCGDDKLIRLDYSAISKGTAPPNLNIVGIKVNGENMCWNNLIQNTGKEAIFDSMALLNEEVTTFGQAIPAANLNNMRKTYSRITFDNIARFYPVPLKLVLSYENRNLTIDFAAIEPDKPKLVVYQYKLEGYDKNWSQPSNSTSAVFGNMPEGTYTFKLKALSPFGVPASTEYMFRVLPPWYRAWWAYLLYTFAFAGIAWGFAHYRSKSLLKDKRKLAFEVKIRTEEVNQQKEEIAAQRDSLEVQRDDLEKTLSELKSTQKQLIQSEKMASLGELTAGIAHEIQNPLNFVNNFSEVSIELAEELQEEIDATEIPAEHKESITGIVADLVQNQQKINFHGKRADAIVKGMLQHSRNNTGQREPTDVNQLADEFLRLSYHGLRAKDTMFNATLQTSFDTTLPLVYVVPQDVGRVLVNIFTNAFYSVTKKKMEINGNYLPTINVTTALKDGFAEIRIRDNGLGIPQYVLDKIYNPFFTTKPTGEGTGLGLSLSYEIITKGHGGTIQAETKEGEFAEFIIRLPISAF